MECMQKSDVDISPSRGGTMTSSAQGSLLQNAVHAMVARLNSYEKREGELKKAERENINTIITKHMDLVGAFVVRRVFDHWLFEARLAQKQKSWDKNAQEIDERSKKKIELKEEELRSAMLKRESGFQEITQILEAEIRSIEDAWKHKMECKEKELDRQTKAHKTALEDLEEEYRQKQLTDVARREGSFLELEKLAKFIEHEQKKSDSCIRKEKRDSYEVIADAIHKTLVEIDPRYLGRSSRKPCVRQMRGSSSSSNTGEQQQQPSGTTSLSQWVPAATINRSPRSISSSHTSPHITPLSSESPVRKSAHATSTYPYPAVLKKASSYPSSRTLYSSVRAPQIITVPALGGGKVAPKNIASTNIVGGGNPTPRVRAPIGEDPSTRGLPLESTYNSSPVRSMGDTSSCSPNKNRWSPHASLLLGKYSYNSTNRDGGGTGSSRSTPHAGMGLVSSSTRLRFLNSKPITSYPLGTSSLPPQASPTHNNTHRPPPLGSPTNANEGGGGAGLHLLNGRLNSSDSIQQQHPNIRYLKSLSSPMSPPNTARLSSPHAPPLFILPSPTEHSRIHAANSSRGKTQVLNFEGTSQTQTQTHVPPVVVARTNSRQRSSSPIDGVELNLLPADPEPEESGRSIGRGEEEHTLEGEGRGDERARSNSDPAFSTYLSNQNEMATNAAVGGAGTGSTTKIISPLLLRGSSTRREQTTNNEGHSSSHRAFSAPMYGRIGAGLLSNNNGTTSFMGRPHNNNDSTLYLSGYSAPLLLSGGPNTTRSEATQQQPQQQQQQQHPFFIGSMMKNEGGEVGRMATNEDDARNDVEEMRTTTTTGEGSKGGKNSGDNGNERNKDEDVVVVSAALDTPVSDNTSIVTAQLEGECVDGKGTPKSEVKNGEQGEPEQRQGQALAEEREQPEGCPQEGEEEEVNNNNNNDLIASAPTEEVSHENNFKFPPPSTGTTNITNGRLNMRNLQLPSAPYPGPQLFPVPQLPSMNRTSPFGGPNTIAAAAAGMQNKNPNMTRGYHKTSYGSLPQYPQQHQHTSTRNGGHSVVPPPPTQAFDPQSTTHPNLNPHHHPHNPPLGPQAPTSTTLPNTHIFLPNTTSSSLLLAHPQNIHLSNNHQLSTSTLPNCGGGTTPGGDNTCYTLQNQSSCVTLHNGGGMEPPGSVISGHLSCATLAPPCAETHSPYPSVYTGYASVPPPARPSLQSGAPQRVQMPMKSPNTIRRISPMPMQISPMRSLILSPRWGGVSPRIGVVSARRFEPPEPAPSLARPYGFAMGFMSPTSPTPRFD